MIQSVKFDSSNMDIKKLSNSALLFVIKRLIEIFGVSVSLIGILIFISLISYSPEDPNFIFPENTEIKNILGYQGSWMSDLILQSIGLIAYLLPITYIFTGLNIFKKKGFNFIDLDIVIDTDLLTQRSGEDFKKYALNFKDQSGKEISLRPDLTIATAIQYIQRKKRETEKLSYFGSAFRLNKKGDLKVFDQIGCEVINSKSSPEHLVLSTILAVFKKLKKQQIILNDIGLFKNLVNSLNLPQRWKLRLIRHYSRKEYFDDLLNRLDTNYDLDNEKIKIDYNKLEDLKKIDGNKIIGGRTVTEIIERFEKKIKDPRDNFNGSRSVKIIKDFFLFSIESFTFTHISLKAV